MNRNNLLAKGLCLASLLSASAGAAAFEDGSMAVYGALGRTPRASNRSTDLASIGVALPLTRWTPWSPGAGSSWYVDLFLSRWDAPLNAYDRHSNNYTQIGAALAWRHRFAEGASPWFVEASLGLTLLDRLYITPDRGFSTRYQFVTQFGGGRSFGADGRHELSLRLQHYSNASIKKPNPGENFVQLRYAYRF